MKNITSYIVKCIGIVALAFGAASAADAAVKIENGGTASSNTVYEFQATIDGFLQLHTSSVIQFYDLLYPNESCSLEQTIPYYTAVTVAGGRDYYYQITKGETYYFYLDFVSADGRNPTFKFTEMAEIPNEIVDVTPAPNTTTAYNMATYPDLRISFLIPKTLTGDVTLQYIDNDGQSASTPLSYVKTEIGGTIAYDFKVRDAISNVKDKIKDMSQFSVIIVDPKIDGMPVKGKYVNAEGNIELDYLYQKETSILTTQYPDPFLSYWKENDPDGKMVFVFDGPLAPMAEQNELTLKIFAGPYVEDGWPELPGAPMTIDGNTLTVDLCGVERITEETTVTIYIFDLLAADGKSVDYYGSGAISLFEIPYVEVKQGQLVYEFTPEGGSLEDVKDIELWVQASSFQYVDIKGFRFSSPDVASVVEISLEDSNPQPDPFVEGSMIYNIPVPESMRMANNVTLSAVLESADMFEYTMSAIYNVDSGVESVLGETGAGDVYTIDGRRVAAGTEETLSPGIYITGGRKVIVK